MAGRLTSANAVTYTQSAGTVNICVVGGCATTPSFGFTSTLPTNVMNISGGTINLVNSNTLTTADYNQQGTINFSGGTVQFGTAATATNFNFRLQGSAPNVVVDNTTNAKTLLLSGTAWVYGNFTVSTGSTLNPNNAILNMFGSTFTNNGTIGPGIVGGATTSRLQFAGAGAQTYTGTGTAGTPADPLFGLANINRGGGLTIDPSVNPIYVARLLAFSGSLTNANKVSLTQATTNVMVIQRGGVAQLPAGTIDVAPSFTTTSAALILVYSQASNAATTGVEVPASRTVESVQDFNTNGITIAGGPLTVTGNAGASPDTVGLFLGGTAAGTAGGPVNTSPSNLLTVAGTGVAALAGGSENAYVNGPLARMLPASLAGTLTYPFPVGKAGYKAIELVNPTTAVGGTVTVQAEAFDADSGGTAGAGLDAINHNRYWYAQITSGAANFTNSSVRVTELNSANNALGQSAALNGAYDSIGGTLLPATVQSAAPTTSLGYFAVGRVATTPTFPGGTYTVGATGNYTTLTAAMADLTGKLITGPITYALQADYSSAAETFPIVVPANGGSSATNTITIKPDTGVTATISGSSASSIIKLNGADYVTIDGSADGSGSRDLTIQNTSSRGEHGCDLARQPGHDRGRNLRHDQERQRPRRLGDGRDDHDIFGIFAGGAAVATNGDNNDYLTIQNNQIDSAYEGIAVRVATVLNGINSGLTITGNTIGSANAANYVQFRGIELIGAVAPVVTQNEIYNLITTTINANIAGIELGSTVYYGQVTRNKIHDLVNNNTAQWGAFGIYASSSTSNFSNSVVEQRSVGHHDLRLQHDERQLRRGRDQAARRRGLQGLLQQRPALLHEDDREQQRGALGRKRRPRAGSISATTCWSTRSPARPAARPTPPG